MPANLKELRGKIRNVKNTQQITKAMKLVSAAKFGRAQQAVIQSRAYFNGMDAMVRRLCSQGEISQHHLVRKNESTNVLVFVVSSQRGLCGGYNANIAKEALAQVQNVVASGGKPTVFCLGRKAYQLLASRLPGVGFEYSKRLQVEESDFGNGQVGYFHFDRFAGNHCSVNLPFDKPSVDLARRLGEMFRSLFLSGSVGEVRLVYSKFGSAISQTPTAAGILPMRPAAASVSGADTVVSDYVFEPDLNTLVSAALPRFLDIQVLQILKEAMASEHGARMTAMDNATRNAKDMEHKYKIHYQRARQAAITTELVEIISGAEAL